MIKSLLCSCLLLFTLTPVNAQMFFSQNYSLARPKTQIYTESFAYPTNTDLVADAPTLWQYSATGFGFEVRSNTIYAWFIGPPDTGNTTIPGAAKWIGPGTFNANQYATATYSSIVNVDMGPAVRVSGTFWYSSGCNLAGCSISKIVNGSTAVKGSCSMAVSGTPSIELEAVGTTPTVLTLYYNGAFCATYTDSNTPLTAGVTGIANVYGSSNSGDTHLSNVTGGNLQ